MVVIFGALDRPVRGSPPGFKSFFGRVGRNQTIAAASDQVLASRLDQGFSDGESVRGLEKLHQRPLHFAIPHVLGDLYRLLGKRVNSRVVKCCGDVWSTRYVIAKVGLLGIHGSSSKMTASNDSRRVVRD
jgi:hypothetical protein